MATESTLVSLSAEAGSDLSTKQYYFVVRNSSGQLALAGNGATADGVLQDKPAAAGRAAAYAISGLSKVVAGAAIARGAQVASDANGKAKTAVTGNRVLGRAHIAAAADGDVISVILKLQGEPNV